MLKEKQRADKLLQVKTDGAAGAATAAAGKGARDAEKTLVPEGGRETEECRRGRGRQRRGERQTDRQTDRQRQ